MAGSPITPGEHPMDDAGGRVGVDSIGPSITSVLPFLSLETAGVTQQSSRNSLTSTMGERLLDAGGGRGGEARGMPALPAPRRQRSEHSPTSLRAADPVNKIEPPANTRRDHRAATCPLIEVPAARAGHGCVP